MQTACQHSAGSSQCLQRTRRLAAALQSSPLTPTRQYQPIFSSNSSSRAGLVPHAAAAARLQQLNSKQHNVVCQAASAAAMPMPAAEERPGGARDTSRCIFIRAASTCATSLLQQLHPASSIGRNSSCAAIMDIFTRPSLWPSHVQQLGTSCMSSAAALKMPVIESLEARSQCQRITQSSSCHPLTAAQGAQRSSNEPLLPILHHLLQILLLLLLLLLLQLVFQGSARCWRTCVPACLLHGPSHWPSPCLSPWSAWRCRSWPLTNSGGWTGTLNVHFFPFGLLLL